jgi:hypothetical protein
MSPEQALAWVKECGVAVESAHVDVASLTEFVTGESLKRSWWGHPKGDVIFHLSRVIRNSPDVLTCRLCNRKITYIHRRLWPALVRLADEFSKSRLGAVKETHTASGKHKVTVTPFPRWVPKEVMKAADTLSEDEAARQLAALLKD